MAELLRTTLTGTMEAHTIASASATRATPVWRDVEVRPGEGVSVLTVRLPAVGGAGASSVNAPTSILLEGDGFQMRGVDAPAVTAEMVNLVLRGNLTYVQPISCTVSSDLTIDRDRVPVEHPVTGASVPAGPLPATPSPDDLTLEPLSSIHATIVTPGGDSH